MHWEKEIIEQLKTGAQTAAKLSLPDTDRYERVIFCGLGGSIMPAEAITMLWLESPLVYLNRTFSLPHWVSSKHLVVCTSWSGQTEETLTAYREAREKKIDVVAVTHGGKLAEQAKKDGVPLILLPDKDLAPRYALGLMLGALLTLIRRSDIINDRLNISIAVGSVEDLAERMVRKIPLIYSSYDWRWLGYVWKRFFNENDKIPAFCHFMPEAGHNDIAGLRTGDNRFFCLVLIDPQGNNRETAKLKQLAKLFKQIGIDCWTMEIEGKNRAEKVLNQYLTAMAVSERLAEKLNVNPLTIEIIEKFKTLS